MWLKVSVVTESIENDSAWGLSAYCCVLKWVFRQHIKMQSKSSNKIVEVNYRSTWYAVMSEVPFLLLIGCKKQNFFYLMIRKIALPSPKS